MAEEKLPFVSHLEELRKRLIICIGAIAVCFTICCFFDQQLVDILTKPLKEVLPPGTNLIFTGISEAFFAYLKVSFFTGLIFASPVILYEIWCFISPGLYNKEKKHVFPFVLFSTILFISGVLFAYYVVLPITYKFFMSYTTDSLKPFPSLREYLSFSTKMLLAFGLTFELPIFIVFLSKIGIASRVIFDLRLRESLSQSVESGVAMPGHLTILHYVTNKESKLTCTRSTWRQSRA